jgi:hypothetical protein
MFSSPLEETPMITPGKIRRDLAAREGRRRRSTPIRDEERR